MSENYMSQIPPGMLLRIINNKQDIIAYYEHLCEMAPDQQNISIIKEILQDEMKSLDLFEKLYVDLFGGQPELYTKNPPQINSFIDGVKISILNELHTSKFYWNIYFADQNIEVRNTFLMAMFDDNSHSIKFTYIYNKFLESKLI